MNFSNEFQNSNVLSTFKSNGIANFLKRKNKQIKLSLAFLNDAFTQLHYVAVAPFFDQ